jgi:hypothetical protein
MREHYAAVVARLSGDEAFRSLYRLESRDAVQDARRVTI